MMHVTGIEITKMYYSSISITVLQSLTMMYYTSISITLIKDTKPKHSLHMQYNTVAFLLYIICLSKVNVRILRGACRYV